MSSPVDHFPMNKNNPILSWEFVLLHVLLLIGLLVMLDRPTGSIAGRLALQQEGFSLYSYDLRQHHVYAIAIGPRGDKSEERGVWVNNDGTFKISNLPVGEYELKVHVPGFATSYDSGIFVVESKTTTLNHDITLQLEQPSINVATNARVFTTHEQPRFWINASGCSQAKVHVYAADMMKLALEKDADKKHGFEITAEFGVWKSYDEGTRKAAEQFFAQQHPIKEWSRAITEEGYSHQEFKFDKPLPPGDYMVMAEGNNLQNKRDWNILWFSVSDMGLVVKQDPWQTLVRAIDLNTLRPLSGAKIKLLNRSDNGTEIAHGVTAADGFVKLQTASRVSGSELVTFGESGPNHAYGGLNFYGGGSGDKYQTMFYTDRPIYRLGQTVYFKGLIRSREVSGLKNPGANMKLSLKVEDPDNNELPVDRALSSLKTNDHGSFNALFEIPKEGKTGAYQVTITYPDQTQDFERFEVAEYRKPEYQVEVVPLSPRVTAGTKAKARVKATYYFGAPVANAKVKYTIFSGVDWNTRYSLMDRPDYYSYFDGWDHEEDYGGSSYGGDYVSEGYTVTDENGEALVEFDTKKNVFQKEKPWEFDHYDHDYKVEAEVTDISRLSVLGDGHVSVTNGDFELFVKPNAYVAKVGESVGAEVRAVSYDAGHKPLANVPVHLQLYRRVYDSVHYTYKGIEVFEETTVNTDANGQAKVSFKTKPQFPTDTYEILATATDTVGNTIADEGSVWVVSENYPYALNSQEAQKEPLTVKLDKDVYKAGETAKVMITAPVTGVEGAQAIVTVEGPKLYSYRVIDMKATAQMVEIPITVDYAPNVYVGVTFIGKKHQFYNQTEMIKVSPQDHFLKVSVDTDKAKYHPGETATYTIKAQYADGRPAPNTEVSLGVVDESIYAIRADNTPDIRSFFYNRRPNAVTTLCSFPEEYSGGPNKIEPRVRKDFRDTAAWQPVLTTDAQGVVKTTVKLPDNLTTWRATAIAINAQTDVGSVRQKIVSTQNVILRLAMPRFFSQGDEGYITAVVHNYTEKPQAIKLLLTAGNQFQVRDSLEQKLIVDPDKAKRYCWPVRVLNAGEASISCKALGDSTENSDAMQIKLPVRPLGVETFVTKSGVLSADDVTINVPAQLPADAMPGTAKLHIYMTPSTIGSLIGNFGSLIDYPYGCTEQTMSKLMPSVAAVRMNQLLGVPLKSEDKERFKKVYKQSMDKLNGYQHDDGGWGWWADDSSQIYLTALVLDGYKQLQEGGYAVPSDRQQNGLAWLEKNGAELVKQLSDPMLKHDEYAEADRTIDLSRAYFVLSRYGRPMPAAARKYAFLRKDRMTPEALSYFTMAFANVHDDEASHAFYNRLIELANTVNGDDGSTLDWAPSKQMFEKLGKKGWWWYSYRYTDVETTALALEAAVTVDAENTDRIENIKRWILLQRSQDGWGNTKTTSEVLRAMMLAETGGGKENVEPDYSVDIGGATLTPFNFSRENRFAKEVDVALAPKTSGSYTIHKHGSGKLYYTTVLTYFKRIQPGQYVAQKSVPDGLNLRREFFRLKPSAPDSNGNVHFTAEPLPDRTVRAGETILMKVYVDAPIQVPYVILEAPLPSGAEVVENDSREYAKEQSDNNNNDSNQQEDTYSFGPWWWTHQDVMDDHLAFFVTDFARGKCELHQMIRMEIPGKFEMNPVCLQGMYTKGVRAYSQADEITVKE